MCCYRSGWEAGAPMLPCSPRAMGDARSQLKLKRLNWGLKTAARRSGGGLSRPMICGPGAHRWCVEPGRLRLEGPSRAHVHAAMDLHPRLRCSVACTPGVTGQAATDIGSTAIAPVRFRWIIITFVSHGSCMSYCIRSLWKRCKKVVFVVVVVRTCDLSPSTPAVLRLLCRGVMNVDAPAQQWLSKTAPTASHSFNSDRNCSAY